MKEIWKDIPTFENYQVSNLGNFFSKKRNKLLCVSHNDKGYCYAQLYKNGKSYHLRLHRLVAKLFISNPNKLPEVNHIDGNKNNNCVTNLEWCDRKHNMQEAFKNGLIPPRKPNKTSFKKGYIPKNAIKINQYDLKGNLLNSFNSIAEASRKTQISETSISRYCNNIRKCKKYMWKYADK